jgi:hypothetical protein
MLAGEQVDDLKFHRDPALGGKQHERAAGGRCRMIVDLHNLPLYRRV